MSGKVQLPTKSNSPNASAVSGILQRKCDCGQHTMGGGQCDECGKTPQSIQRATRSSELGTRNAGGVPPIVHEVLRSPGQPLDAGSRAYFEQRFGQDFSHVRVHTAPRAAESARAINALAYTAGRNIVFEGGQYNPESAQGRQLLAHELAHVVQQKNGAASGGYSLLPSNSGAEREAEQAARLVGDAQRPQLNQSLSPNHIGRVTKPGDEPPANAPGKPPGAGPAANPAANPSGGQPPQKLRFDILGADTALVDFLTKAAGISRNPDLRVTSLEDLINQLESKAPPNSNQCVEHISIFNHGMPGSQALTGQGEKKVATGGGAPGKLPSSGFRLAWLYQAANQAALGRLRKVFCCDANMFWLGCGTAGVMAEGGKRTEKELKESEYRYGKEFGDRYRDEKDAQAHGANLKAATLGLVNVQSWADATCTTIRAATDFVNWDVNNPTQFYKVGYEGEFRFVKPSAAGQCSCDLPSGRVQGAWTPGQAIDYGDAKWKADLAAFSLAVKPASGSPTPAAITQTLLALLADVGPGLTIPAGLPLGTKVEPWVNPNSTDPNWVAYTYDHLPFCFPNDCWKWIGVNRTIIQQTPSFTKTTLAHELQHAADMNVAAFEYQLINGASPPAPAAACNPGYTPTTADAYGKYILDFRKFYQTGMSASRHLEIYASSAAPNFKRFTPDEKLSWFSAMISTVPPDIPVREALPSESLVDGVFQNPLAYEATMRAGFSNQLFKATQGFIFGNSQGQGKDLGKAKTLLNHFSSVWAMHPSDRAMLYKALSL